MFPSMPGVTFDDDNRDVHLASRRETKPLSRMETHRLLLEHKKMYHLNSMSVDERAGDRDRDLARRQLIAQARGARGTQVSLTSKFRQAFGGALIAIGERIRPRLTQGEPTFNR